MRCVSTRVFPDPAPATTRSGPSPCATASCWTELRPARRSGRSPPEAARSDSVRLTRVIIYDARDLRWPGLAAPRLTAARSLPFDRGRWLGRDVVRNSVHAGNLADDAR